MFGEPATLEKYWYGDRILVGAYRPGLGDFDKQSPTPYGLHPLLSGTFAWVRSESGAWYSVMRIFNITMTPRLRLFGGAGFDAVKQSYRGYISDAIEGDEWVVAPDPGSARADAFRFAVTPGTGASWSEDGILDLSFTELGPAAQMYYPHPRHPWYWTIAVMGVSGEILGERVEGIGEFELNWSHGLLNWTAHPLHTDAADLRWIYYAHDYDDGGSEYGILGASERDRGCGLVVRDGEPRLLYGLTSRVAARRDDGLADTIAWEVPGAAWECRLESGSLTPGRMPGAVWQCGHTHLEGDARRPSGGLTFVESHDL